jgi:hypothetical protein
MRAWHFSETACHLLPPAETYDSIRVSLPNKHYDPAIGAGLYHRFLDEWLLAEDEGLDLMLNEHHQTATCVDPAAPLMLSILARQTTNARLLILGNPIANRRQPVRVAEEMAMIDVLSRGRLEVGFVRGEPYEISPANSNPMRMNEREWEALDLIIKAWTNHDGPVSFEGRFFHNRAINIWPRPWQQPHPPIWISTTSPGGAARVGSKGYVQATFLTGFDGTRSIFDYIVPPGVPPAAAMTCRSTASPTPPWSTSVKPRQRRKLAPKSCCGTLRRTRCRRISLIRPAMPRSRPGCVCCAARSIR